MAENLNQYMEGGGNYCYNGTSSLTNNANCDKYGRLYEWTRAKTACPEGWHLPSQSEWRKLHDFVEQDSECASCVGKKLKAASDWDNGGNGTDDYGFAGLPGGRGIEFLRIGTNGYWWSVTEKEDDADFAFGWSFTVVDEVIEDFYDKERMFSIRCIKD